MKPIDAYKRAKQFVLREVWTRELTDMRRWHKIGFHWLRTLSLAVHGFIADKCPLRAAALSLVFMFALAPTLAVAFAIAKGFGAQDLLRKHLSDVGFLGTGAEDGGAVEGIGAVLNRMLDYVEGTSVGALGTIGVIILLFTAYKLLSAVEKTMNDIWGVRWQRPFVRKIVDYIAVVFVLPIMLMITALVTASIKIASVVENLEAQQNFFLSLLADILKNPVLSSLLGVTVTILFAAIGFWFLYYFFPNRRVPVTSAIAGALVAAVAFNILQWLFVQLQVGVSRANAVYGSFAAVPIFLLFLQFSWLVVLFGAEVSYAYANQKDLEYGGLTFDPSPGYRQRLAVGVMALTGWAFYHEKEPLSTEAMARQLGAPVRVMRDVVDTLVGQRLLSELQGDTTSFQPAIPLEQISLWRIVRAVQESGDESRLTERMLEDLGLTPYLDQLHESERKAGGTTLLDVVKSEPEELPTPERELHEAEKGAEDAQEKPEPEDY